MVYKYVHNTHLAFVQKNACDAKRNNARSTADWMLTQYAVPAHAHRISEVHNNDIHVFYGRVPAQQPKRNAIDPTFKLYSCRSNIKEISY